MVIGLCVVQFWSEIILVISVQTCDFKIKRMIPDQIALHSVQLPWLLINHWFYYYRSFDLHYDKAGELKVIVGHFFQ